MTELFIYGTNGLFHNIVKQSAIMNGRYAVLEKGPFDLNLNNLLSGLDIPGDKYPIVACLPPASDVPGTLQGSDAWEIFQFRLLFLCRTYMTGDNQIKLPDFNTNSSLHRIAQDWADMKNAALGFMNALEQLQRKPALRGAFRLAQRPMWRIARVSSKLNDNLSGVLLLFSGELATPCEFTDINISSIEIPTDNHPQHFH